MLPITRRHVALIVLHCCWSASLAAQESRPATAAAPVGAAAESGAKSQQAMDAPEFAKPFAQQQRPPGDPAVVARGKALYGVMCTACHGVDLRGGDQGGPNLLRSQLVLLDKKGEKILDVVRSGRQGPAGVMPAFPLPETDVLAIAEYVHSVLSQVAHGAGTSTAGASAELNVLVGNASAGEARFRQSCSGCHSTSGDLRGIGARVADARELQNLWVAGSSKGRPANASKLVTTVTVEQPGSTVVTGALVRIDDFIVTVLEQDGSRRTFRREGDSPKVTVHNPLEPHRQLALTLSDSDMHDVTAYLATVK